MPEIQYPTNPNSDTAFVVQENGTKNRALMTAPQDTSTLELPSNANSTKGYVTIDGKKQRVVLTAVLAGGGDSHNKGYFATQAALEEAHPTAEAGDYAIVGSTDTVWVWDEDTSAWKDSDTKGQVTSVNGQTGDVSLSIPDAVQYSTMPTASVDNLGDIVQFTGTTDANYTNGYFYQCVSDGQDPATYSWTQVSVQPAGATYTAGTGINIDANNEISVTNPVVTNSATEQTALAVGSISNPATASSGAYWAAAVGANTSVTAADGVAVGANASTTAADGVAIGPGARVTATHAIQISSWDRGTRVTNSVANTVNIANGIGNYRVLEADGTVPTDRLTHAINKYSSMPTASASNEGWIVQFTGTTDATYTHGYIYECKAQGTDPETYTWEAMTVQAGGGGGSSYTAGTGINITNDVISVKTPVVASASGLTIVPGDTTPMNNGVSIGVGASTNISGTAIGRNASAGDVAVAIGYTAEAPYGGISLGDCTGVGSEFHIGLARLNETTYRPEVKTYKLFGFDGLMPADRIAPTTGLADGNYRLRLVMASGVPTLEWVAE